MKDLMKRLSCLLLVLLAGIAFTSCGNDDDENDGDEPDNYSAVNTSLVGTWEYTYEEQGYPSGKYYSYTDRYILDADGSGRGSERYSSTDPDSEPDTWTFNWSYNESTKILTMVNHDEDGDEVDYFYVSEVNNNFAILYDLDEDGQIDYEWRTILYRVK
jgi:hypothetical protein